MTLYGGIFYAISAIILISTGAAITRRNPVHSVVYLVVSFFGTALLFYLLGAPLLAALEVIIYAGAIMVLFLFIIMTLQPGSQPVLPAVLKWTFPIVMAFICLGLGGLLVFLNAGMGSKLVTAMASPLSFGHFLFEYYWYPIEIASLLLFVGLVGALYLGKMEGKFLVKRDYGKKMGGSSQDSGPPGKE